MLQNGDVIDGIYQIVREIGKGGTGVIYLGYHLRLQKQVIIKRIKDNAAGRMNVRAEADILKRLHHTYLPQVFDFLIVGSGIYTVMDYIPGHDLQYYLDNGYQFPESTIRLWMAELCDVLDYLHSQNPRILHSDIKPANIMITPEGHVCLIDFNVSLDGETSKELQGISVNYAAPEQYRYAMDKLYKGSSSVELDGRMDIYSLGAVFYRLMTGYYSDPEKGAPYPITQMDIPYSAGLKAVVAKAIEVLPNRRFSSARRMGEALRNTEKMDPEYRKFSWMQILSGFAGGILAVAGVLLIYTGVGICQQDSWKESYRSLYEATEAGDETRIVTEGTAMLNDFLLKGYMKRHPEEKAEVLHAVGDSYYRQEQYASAAQYYKEALDSDEDESSYLRDYLVASARGGSYVDAQAAAAQYPSARLGDAELRLIEAESDYARGDYAGAFSGAQEALETASDRELEADLYGLMADAAAGEEDYERAAEAAVQAAQTDDSAELLRKAGSMAFNAGNEASADTVKRSWYEKSLSYYERLCARDDPSYEDCLNRALALRALGRYGESRSRLQEMRREYPEDYRVLMWICYDILDEAASEGDYSDVESDLGFVYDSCRHIYDGQGTEDEDMERLIGIVEGME